MTQTQTSKTVIRRCDIDTIRNDATELLEAHWEELGRHKQLMVLDPDWHQYYELEEKGMLVILSVEVPGEAISHDPRRHGMVGYSVTIISSHQHSSGLKIATNDVLFLHKDWRVTGLGLRLIRATEAEARERGAQIMLWHAKPDTALSVVLPRMDYDVADLIYSKGL